MHVFVPVAQPATSERRGRDPALAARAERLDPALATTAFVLEDRDGKVFLDATRAGGATVVAAYSPRVRPGPPVSFPVAWDDLDRVAPADFTVRTVPALLGDGTRGPSSCPSRSRCRADLIAEGHAIPVARVAGDARGQAPRPRAAEAGG